MRIAKIFIQGNKISAHIHAVCFRYSYSCWIGELNGGSVLKWENWSTMNCGTFREYKLMWLRISRIRAHPTKTRALRSRLINYLHLIILIMSQSDLLRFFAISNNNIFIVIYRDIFISNRYIKLITDITILSLSDLKFSNFSIVYFHIFDN